VWVLNGRGIEICLDFSWWTGAKLDYNNSRRLSPLFPVYKFAIYSGAEMPEFGPPPQWFVAFGLCLWGIIPAVGSRSAYFVPLL
jgi:hypothetical protein